MNGADIDEIELKLGIQLPSDYRQFMIAGHGKTMSGILDDVHEIISANQRNRHMSWLGRSLDPVFYIFAIDEAGREIFMDLDVPGPVIMAADYERKRGAVLARNFHDWVS